MSTNLEIYTCKICNHTYKNGNGLSTHLRRTHKISSKNYYDTYLKKPNEGICPTCGKETPFKSLMEGYQIHCSNRCTRLDPIVKSQIENTFISKYGEITAFKIDRIKNSSHSESANAKRKQTCLNRFGCEYQISSESTRAKIKQSCLDRFGKENPMQSEEFIQEIKKRNLEKYGYEWHTQSKEFNDKLKSIFMDRYNVKNPFQIDPKTIQAKAKATMLERYGVDSAFKLEWVREKSNHSHSKNEDILITKIREFYSDYIESNYIKLIYPYEVDIYFPELNLAIEYNGNYWHSYPRKPKDYHLMKSLLCRNTDTRLIHIYEFENLEKQLQLLKDLIDGIDNYPKDDFNKNNLINVIPNPEIIYNYKYIIYGAGQLY